MASATGIPEVRSVDAANHGRGEEEPLLGRAGDASQQEDQGLQFNFVIGKCPPLLGHSALLIIPSPGTAVIAQVGIWIVIRCTPSTIRATYADLRFQLAATIWASVFVSPLALFSAHPV